MKINFDNYQLIIFDTITQPFFQLSQTNKNILFLDITKQKIKPNIYKLIKDRALTIKINPKLITAAKLNKYIVSAIKFKIKNFKICDYSF